MNWLTETPFWHVAGEVLAITVIVSLASLALTEYLGARVPGFWTISDATRSAIAQSDYRLFAAVFLLLQLTAIWWLFHTLYRL